MRRTTSVRTPSVGRRGRGGRVQGKFGRGSSWQSFARYGGQTAHAPGTFRRKHSGILTFLAPFCAITAAHRTLTPTRLFRLGCFRRDSSRSERLLRGDLAQKSFVLQIEERPLERSGRSVLLQSGTLRVPDFVSRMSQNQETVSMQKLVTS